MSGIKRNVTQKAQRLLSQFPILIIIGARQGGKTTLAKQLRPDWAYFDLERGSDYEKITSDFDFFFKENPEHLILDEAQFSPELFRELRGVVDRNRAAKNRFILTGSGSFELVRNVSESLAGRAAILELGTFKANEVQQRPLSPLYTLFESPLSPKQISFLKELEPQLSHKAIKDVYFKGGYPEPVLSNDPAFHLEWMTQYHDLFIQRDIRKLFPRLDIVKFQRFIAMLGSLSGGLVNKSELGRSVDTSEVTIRDYLDIAHHSFIWRNIPSFEKSDSKSLVKMPKGYIRDSGLSHFLKGLHTPDSLERYPNLGLDFEAFVIDELIKGLEALSIGPWKASYFRTKNGAEIDLILEGPFGLLPIEIKYGLKTEPKRLHALKQFITDHNLPFGLVINNSDHVEKLTDTLIQIPVGLL